MQVLQRPYDDPADNNPEFWQKCPTNKTLLSQAKIYESLLAVKRKGNKKESKFRTFRLIDDILICFSRKNLHQIKVLELNKVICTIDISKEKDPEFPYGFSLCYNGKMQTFRSKEEEIIKEWMQALSWYSVSLDFEKKYKVLNKLGSGGYAKVYLVDYLPTNQQYAAKMIHFPKQDKSKDKKKHRDMILNEILALKKLDHPNVVKMNALYCVSGELCIVMEYIRGKKMIEDLKQKGRYSERKTAIIAKQLLLTLGYIHEKNIIHRDLKPENLLINQEDDNLEVKLVDFGLAAFIGLKYQGFKKCGTAGFIAPEIFRDEPFSDQIDVFSLGVILYVCLCGKPPFKGKNYYDLLKKNYLCEYKFNFKYWHNVSEEAKNLVSRMMDPYPNSRITIKEALNHEWFKVALKTDPSRSRSASKHLSQKKETELLKPGMKEGSNSNIQLNEDSVNSAKVPDMTQKLKSLIFSSPNLSGNKDRLMQAKLPSFYQLSGVLSPTNKTGDMADADKLAEAENRDKKNEDFLRLNEPSNLDLTSQLSFLRATPSNYDSPYQINIYTCKNVEDISDGEADDNAEGLQKLMKLYKNNSLKIKKPRESSPAKSINKTPSNSKRKRDHSKTHTSASKKEASDSRKTRDDQSIPIENPSAKTEISKSKVKGDSTPKNT